MKRFFSQPALRDFITLKNSAKPHLLLRNALALSRHTKIIEFYEQTLPIDMKNLSDQELFGVLRAYLQTIEHRNVSAAKALIADLEKRKYDDVCNLEIQKMIICSENSIEDVVLHFKRNLAIIPEEQLADFYTGFLEIICGTYHRLEAGLNILDFMLEKGLSPTPEIILILLKNTTALGDSKTAMELIKRVESGVFGFEINKEMVVQGAKTLAMHGDITSVAHMLEYIKVKNWNQGLESFAPLMMANEKSGYLDGVVQMYLKFRKKNMPPTHEMMEILMRSHANDNNISGVVKNYGILYVSKEMKHSLEMHTILIQAHLKVKEEVIAWNRCFDAIDSINRNKDYALWNIPKQLVLPIAQNAQGKHVAFVLDRITLSELPRSIYPKFITTLISHLVSKDANDAHLAILLAHSLLPGGQFEDLSSSESQLSALICMAKLQKNELDEALEIFKENLDTWSSADKFKVFSELVKAHLINGKVKNAVSVYLEAQKSGYVSSPLMESLLANSDKLDASILQNMGQVAIDSGCIPCPKNEPLLYKRMADMNAYGKI
jgi:hypothetical protein